MAFKVYLFCGNKLKIKVKCHCFFKIIRLICHFLYFTTSVRYHVPYIMSFDKAYGHLDGILSKQNVWVC
jgi:hypothetical protein